ncbi:prepilin-type N-terminal cleavage/methylation domain-containing protein [Verrucomicrobium sp. BvORR106]|uniref:prepilin-type N-terminal cleavage/methylation domain-containing protein n=1 Tax=Verrucomicrobium sp. BvORR106 TaxID=1403819 RepID=UPI00056E50AD|nr:prepilin-type N-terminal cleavage/methylation domain-containing protein [Verrucomicrobium sp. BvORR106]
MLHLPLQTKSLRSSAAFTLVELLVTTVIIAILITLTISGQKMYRGLATRATCSANLRQLGTAVNMYVSDNHGYFPAYVQEGSNGDRTWFFGKESGSGSEGDRDLDRESGPLYPYIQEVGKIEVCPAFNYEAAVWKPKFKGASYGYGYNWMLGGRFGGAPMNVSQLKSGAQVILFGDCGQVNTFQAPASPSKPMLEEFYLINETDKTIHFRHNGTANMLFVDGHIEVFKPFEGSLDKRIKTEVIGRITKRGSTMYLK